MVLCRGLRFAVVPGLALVFCLQAAKVEAMNVTLKPYYFEEELLIEADTSAAEVADRKTHRLNVEIRGAKADKVLARGVIHRSGPHRYGRGQLSLKGLVPGEYRLVARLLTARGRPLTKSLTLPLQIPAKPEWYNSKAGVSDEVLPPWTPLKVKGTTVSCWGREYRFTDSPFPSQIVSAGEEMLKAPIAVKVTRNGKVIAWHGGTIKVVESKPHVVILRSEADSEVLSLSAETAIEYDGMVNVDCTFTPKRPVSVDGLVVAIPLKQERSLYFNSPWATRFSDALKYAGHIDRDGWEWKHAFVPSLNLRDNERGLDWACESDEGWKPYDRPDTLRVYRKGDRVTLEVRVLRRAMLRKPLKVSMILEATPVRPFPKGYRKFNIIHFEGGPTQDGLTWDIPGFGRTAYPIRGIERAAEMGARTLIFHELWSHGFGRPLPYRPKEFKKVVQYAHHLGMKVLVYYGAGFWADSPEYRTYQWDWDVLPRKGEVEGAKQAAPGRKDMMYIGCCPRGGQYLNYLAHGLRKLIVEYDIDGIYIDGGEAFPCANLRHGCGYADRTTGKERPTWRVLASRVLRKRLYTALHESGKEVLIDQHMPYGQTAPIHAFTTTYLAGEPLAHSIPPDYRLPLAWMRQEFAGVQFGAPAEILVYNNNLIQKYMAAALIHGAYLRVLTSDYLYLPGADIVNAMSQVWKLADNFGIEDAKWLPYWKNAGLVRVSPDVVKVSLYQRPDKGILLFVGNTSSEDSDATIELDARALGLPEIGLKAEDALLKKRVPLTGAKFSLKMKAETFRAVWLRAEGTGRKRASNEMEILALGVPDASAT